MQPVRPNSPDQTGAGTNTKQPPNNNRRRVRNAPGAPPPAAAQAQPPVRADDVDNTADLFRAALVLRGRRHARANTPSIAAQIELKRGTLEDVWDPNISTEERIARAKRNLKRLDPTQLWDAMKSVEENAPHWLDAARRDEAQFKKAIDRFVGSDGSKVKRKKNQTIEQALSAAEARAIKWFSSKSSIQDRDYWKFLHNTFFAGPELMNRIAEQQRILDEAIEELKNKAG